MIASTYTIEPLDRTTVSDEQIVALNGMLNQLKAERVPDEPPDTVEFTAGNLRHIPEVFDLRFWQVLLDREPIGYGFVAFIRAEENQHLGQIEMGILPEHRCQGLGTRLLHQLATVAKEEGRTLLIGNTNGTIPAGRAFAERIGAQEAMSQASYVLDIADLNRDLLPLWRERATERASDFELGLWEGPYPEEELDAISEMMKAMNLAPRGDLEVEDFNFTPEQIRQMDHSMVEEGVERWTMYVRQRESGDLAGYTEVFWNPHRPERLGQGLTAVFERYQGRGLGRWLKAAMLEKVLTDRPQVRRIETGNADSNAPMRAINGQLGFKLHHEAAFWQLPVEQALNATER